MAGVTFHLQAGRYQDRDNGKFAGMVEAATHAAAYNAARQGAADARGIYAGSGLGWDLEFSATGGGGSWEIACMGQWAEAQEFGIPGHPISPHDPMNVLYKRGEFGPIFPRGRGVEHPGVSEVRAIETAGDTIAHEFEGILVSYLP
jgi:hypothetical protein